MRRSLCAYKLFSFFLSPSREKSSASLPQIMCRIHLNTGEMNIFAMFYIYFHTQFIYPNTERIKMMGFSSLWQFIQIYFGFFFFFPPLLHCSFLPLFAEKKIYWLRIKYICTFCYRFLGRWKTKQFIRPNVLILDFKLFSLPIWM